MLRYPARVVGGACSEPRRLDRWLAARPMPTNSQSGGFAEPSEDRGPAVVPGEPTTPLEAGPVVAEESHDKLQAGATLAREAQVDPTDKMVESILLKGALLPHLCTS